MQMMKKCFLCKTELTVPRIVFKKQEREISNYAFKKIHTFHIIFQISMNYGKINLKNFNGCGE